MHDPALANCCSIISAVTTEYRGCLSRYVTCVTCVTFVVVRVCFTLLAGRDLGAPACRLGRAEVTISGHSDRCQTRCCGSPLKKEKIRRRDSCVRSEEALQRLIMGTCVASMIVPTVPMRFAPSWARGEGAVTSLLRMLGMAATKALNGPVALVVLTARHGRIRVCRPREVRSGHGSRGYTRKNRMSLCQTLKAKVYARNSRYDPKARAHIL